MRPNKMLFPLMLVIAIFAGCDINKNSDQRVRVGAILPLTGYGAYNAAIVKKGLELSVKQMHLQNEEVEILYEDSKTSPRDAITSFKRLEALGIKNFIVQGGPLAMAIAPMTKGKDMVLFGLATTETDFVHVSDCAVRMSPCIDQMSCKMANFNRQVLSNNYSAIVYISQEYGRSSSLAYKKWYEKDGGTITSIEDYGVTERDFKNIISHVAKLKPQAIHLIGVGDSISLFIRQWYNDPNGKEVQITGDMTFALPNIIAHVGDIPKDLYYVDSIVTDEFSWLYKKEFAESSCSYAAYSYVIPQLLIRAKKEGLEGRKAADFIRSSSHETVLGRLTFSPDGDATMDLKVYRISKDLKSCRAENF